MCIETCHPNQLVKTVVGALEQSKNVFVDEFHEWAELNVSSEQIKKLENWLQVLFKSHSSRSEWQFNSAIHQSLS